MESRFLVTQSFASYRNLTEKELKLWTYDFQLTTSTITEELYDVLRSVSE